MIDNAMRPAIAGRRPITTAELEQVSGGTDALILAGEVIGAIAVITIGTGIAIAISSLTVPIALALTAAVYAGGYFIGTLIQFDYYWGGS